MIVSNFGGELVLVREATLADVKKIEGRKPDAIDKERIGYGMLWVGHFADNANEPRLIELARVKADGGWAEIDDARRKIMGEKRYAEASGMPV